MKPKLFALSLVTAAITTALFSLSTNPVYAQMPEPVPAVPSPAAPSVPLLPAAPSDPGAPPGPGETLVVVPASGPWVNTGIQLTAGESLRITAAGAWNPGLPSSGPVGPDGSRKSWPDNFLNITDLGSCAFCAVTQTPKWAALIGYIGNAPPAMGSYSNPAVLPEAKKIFLIGSDYQAPAPRSGLLWLNINDDAYSGNVSDNTGQVAATIGLQLTRNDLILAFDRLRDAARATILELRDDNIELNVRYVMVTKPDWRLMAADAALGKFIDFTNISGYTPAFFRLLQAFGYAETFQDVTIGLMNFDAGLGKAPTEQQVRDATVRYLDQTIKMRLPDGRVYIGFNALLAALDADYESYVAELPDPLPADYPLESMIREIRQMATAIRVSQKQEVHVPDYSASQPQCCSIILGAFNLNQKQFYSFAARSDYLNNVSFKLTQVTARTLGVGYFAKAGTLALIPATGGATLAAEPVFWGTTANVGKVYTALKGFTSLLNLTVKDQLLTSGMQAEHQALIDAILAKQMFTYTAGWAVRRAGELGPSAVPAAVGQAALQVDGVWAPDVVLTGAQASGTGTGTAAIRNAGTQSLTVTVVGEIYAAIIGGEPVIAGLIAQGPAAIVEPGATADLTFTYLLPRSSSIDTAGYQLKLFGAAINAAGEIVTSAPQISNFWVGTKAQIGALGAQNFATLFEGNVASGLPVSTSYRSSSSARRVQLAATGGTASDFDLHVYDSAGRHTGMNYQTGQVEAAIPGSSYAGDFFGAERIFLYPTASTAYRVVIVGIDTSSGEEVVLTATETPNLPALLETSNVLELVDPANDEVVPIQLFVHEYGRFSGISNLSVSSSDLVDGFSQRIPATNVTFDAPAKLRAGQSLVIDGTIRIDPTGNLGTYHGQITVTGIGASDGAPITATVPLEVKIGRQLFLPAVAR